MYIFFYKKFNNINLKLSAKEKKYFQYIFEKLFNIKEFEILVSVQYLYYLSVSYILSFVNHLFSIAIYL